jgi:TolB protein
VSSPSLPPVASSSVFLCALSAALSLVLLSAPSKAAERQYVEVTGANFKPLPLALVPASGPADAAKDFTDTLRNDLLISGLFDLLDPRSFLVDPEKEGTAAATIDFTKWRAVGADSLVKVKLTPGTGNTTLTAEFWLFDVLGRKDSLHGVEGAGRYDAARLAHRCADRLYEHFTGEKGVFQTRVVFTRKVTSSSEKEIWSADFDGHNAVSLTPGGGLNLLPSWSRDGRSVVFTSYRKGSPMLYVVDVASRAVRPLPVRGELQTGGVFSPDGKLIAFTMSQQGNSDIYVMNPDGSGLRAVTATRELETSPTWSPDGKRLAFVSTRSGDPQLFAANADGSGVERLTLFHGSYNQTPCWSPRGDVIAFTARDERNAFDLFTVDVQSKKVKRLTQDAGNNEHPSFSPNGRHIIFTSTRGGKTRLWLMNADGTNPRPLAFDAEGTSPSWGPWTH